MSNAIAGHGALYAMEKDGDLPGTFTDIAELNADLTLGMNRPETEVTPHQEDIDSWVGGVLRRDAWTFSVNFIFDNATHDHLTGLQKRIIDGDTFGMRFRGPSSGAGANVDEIIASGFLTNFTQTNPVRQDARTAEVTFRPSGAMKIDGVTVS